ncbi:MAG TPA: glycosyltransferase family 39 protein [Verrucomicrobiae bacterium]|nr:glycosyltransferase family 39 protein [Verrucomicrobiae bacterium]
MQKTFAGPAEGEPVERFARRDWWAALLVFGAALAMRLPFRSQFTFHWDSALFALAVGKYNVSLGQPHVPGFFLYVMLGRIVNLFVGEPHASLVWMSVVAGAVLAGVGYLLGTAFFGRDCGWVTGCLLASSPLCWFQSEVALTTIVDSALVTAAVLVCWRAVRRGGAWGWVLAMAVMLSLVAGVRQQTAVVLCPLWLYCFWRFPSRRWAKLLAGVLLVGILCLTWFVPMVRLSGGLGAYLQLYPARVRLNAADSIWKINLGRVLAENSAFVAVDCWTGLSLAALLAAAEFVSWLRSGRSRWRVVTERAEQLRFIAIWLVPMYLFGVLMVVPVPGHILNYFPSLVILVAFGLSRLVRRIVARLEKQQWPGLLKAHRLAAISVISCVTLANMAVFLLPPRQTAWLRAGMPLTASDIREHDRQLDCWIQTIRANYRPEDVMICHYRQYFSWGFRLFQYHMPDYENCLLTPDRAIAPALTNKLWYANNRRLEFEDGLDLHGRKQLILIVPPGQTIDLFTNVFDVSQAQRQDIPGCLPLYTLAPAPDWLASHGIKP